MRLVLFHGAVVVDCIFRKLIYGRVDKSKVAC